MAPDHAAHAAAPQAVTTPLTSAAMFVVLTIDAGGEDATRSMLAELTALVRTVGFRSPEDALVCVAGIGSDAWDRLFDAPKPHGLHPFRELTGARHHAPATPGDLILHIRAGRMDLCFELASLAFERLRGAAGVVDEVHGFKYFDNRDLLGFVDGTENPEGAARGAATLVGDEDAEYAGSSYLIVQKYLHDLDAWNALPVPEQELVIGRRKLSNEELDDDSKPSNSHVALNTVEEPDGTQRQILRDNMPFGRVGEQEFGTYFAGYASTPEVIEQMLTNMFIGDPPGNYDRILDFSTAHTGNLFFVPTADFLDNLPAPARSRCADEKPTETPDDSLGIGSLAGSSREKWSAPL